MFERFTERARQVVVLAQDEARLLKHNYIGTEHILLGLLREEEGLACRVLESLDVTAEEVRAQVARIVGVGNEVTTGQIPFTPNGKKALELSLREALSIGHNYIGTEHILLGLVRVGDGVAAGILRDFGADAETIRNEIMRMLSGPSAAHPVVPLPPFVATTPPLAPEVGEEIDRVRREKEEAIERQDFEEAASLRERERRLVQAARELQHAWKADPSPARATGTAVATVRAVPVPGAHRAGRGRVQRRRLRQAETLLVGWAMFGVAAALGVLLGWLIWH